ncbi:MAG: hypothetical protein HY315_04200 [Acidobacteria bacterium]|nr:hypothetical protein [Acidobacteriota bacterium]
MSPDWNSITKEGGGTAGPRSKGSNATLLIIGVAALFAVALLVTLYYGNEQAKDIRSQIASNQELIVKRLDDADGRLAKLQSQLTVTQERVGLTQRDLERAQAMATQLKAEQEKNVRRLSTEIAEKASTEEVKNLKETTQAEIGSVSEHVGAVKSEVGSVKSEVGTVKDDLKGTRDDLERTKRDLASMNLLLDEQGKLIATNAEGLETLRMKGEREYVEFDISKRDKAKAVGDIRLELRKADAKKQNADIRIFVNDTQVDKGKVYINEPVHFRQGRQALDYEIVVNQVMKDQIKGYLSTPKNRALAASGPKF